MTDKFRGESWADFIAGLRDRSIQNPFLVREDNDLQTSWFLYGSSEAGLVYVLTVRKERRSWKTLDGAVRDLAREIPDFPSLLIHASPDAVPLDSLGYSKY